MSKRLLYKFRYPDRYFSRDSSQLTTEYKAYYHCIAILHIAVISLLYKHRNMFLTELCLIYAKCERSSKLFPLLSRVSGSVRMFVVLKKCLFYAAPPCNKQSLMSQTTLTVFRANGLQNNDPQLKVCEIHWLNERLSLSFLENEGCVTEVIRFTTEFS